MVSSNGLRLSLFGLALLVLSMAALLFLPKLVPAIGMMVGGSCVMAGFIWTLLVYYLPGN